MLLPEERIRTKKQLKEYLNAELPRYKASGIKYFFQASENAILKKHQKRLRKTEYYINSGKKIRAELSRFRLIKMQNKYAIHIPINVCKKGLKIVHIGPILINSNAEVGENCAFHINTAVVAGGVDSESPKLGNGVVMGVGSTALGGIILADNIAVGAGAVVTKDFLEPDIAIAGVPAKKINNNGRTKWNPNSKRKKELNVSKEC